MGMLQKNKKDCKKCKGGQGCCKKIKEITRNVKGDGDVARK